MTSAISKYMPRWLMAIIAAALVLATLVGSSQDSAEAIDPADTDTVYIADGTNFADALMGATIASLNTSPMLGVAGTNGGDTIPGDTADELDRLTNDKTDLLDTIFIFGGAAAVSASVETQLGQWANDVQRIEGDSRWGTYEAISQMLPSAIDEAVHAQEADNADTLDGFDSSELGLLDATVLPADCTSLSNVTDTYQKIGDIGTFDVVDAGTTVEATFQGGIFVGSVTDGNGVVFELRIDDTPSSVGRARAVVRTSQAGERINASIVGVFDGLATGTHSVSLWARVGGGNDASTAAYDPGCWSSDKVLVKELR